MATVRWEIGAVTAMLRALADGPETIGELKKASAIAGFKVEREAKINITRMVYSQPERGYRRTGTLRRSIHTAPPGTDHGEDYARARSGDMGGRQSPSIVGEEGGNLVTEVGTWLRYAARVHNGTGPRMTPRPYLTDALTQNRKAVEDIIARGVVNALTRATR